MANQCLHRRNVGAVRFEQCSERVTHSVPADALRVLSAKSINRAVHWHDLGDIHHEVIVRVREKMEQLQCTQAYTDWETRVTSNIASVYRLAGYCERLLLEEDVAEWTHTFEENFQ